MTKRRIESAVTLPEMDRLGAKLARLYPKHASLEPGIGGHTPEWRKETAQVIAAAVGAYTQGRPKRRFPVMLMLLKLWPEGLPANAVPTIIGITTGVLAHRFQPTWATIPSKLQHQVGARLHSDALASSLVEEFQAPSPCWKCKGHGKVRVATLDPLAAHGLAPIVEPCPVCLGAAESSKSLRARSQAVGISAYHFKRHVGPVYERTLAGYRFLADSAIRGVLDRLG